MNSLKCVRCSYDTPQDDSIFLQCEHIVCYNCGQQLVLESSYPQQFQFECRCGQITQFDKQVIDILKKYKPQPKQQSIKDVQINQIKCLYCFDCNSQCFSIQEYLSGIHKNHDVKYIRKAYQQLEQNSQQMIDKIKELKIKIQTKQKKLKFKKKQVKQVIESQKIKMGILFDKLRNTINTKQKQLYQQIDKMYQKQYLNKIQSSIEMFNSKLDGLDNYLDQINQNILSQETSYTKAFTYYNKNKDANHDNNVQLPSIKNSLKFDQQLIGEAADLISKIQFQDEVQKRQLLTKRNIKSKQVAQVDVQEYKSNDSYTQYFKKAKEEILARKSQIDLALRKKQILIPLNQSSKASVLEIPQNIKSGLLKYSIKPKLNNKIKVDDTQNQIKFQAKERIDRIESMFYGSIENVQTKRRSMIYQ